MAASQSARRGTDLNRARKLKSGDESEASGVKRGNAEEAAWDRRSRTGKQGGWVSELEGISERVEAEGRIRRDQSRNGNYRRTSRGLDGQSRRKVGSGRKEQLVLLKSGRNHQAARAGIRNSPKKTSFPLANLEAYLKERGPASVVKESLGFSPSSRPLQYSSTRLLQKQQLVRGPSNVSESSVRGKPHLVSTYASAIEAVDSDDTERSGCGRMPWHWPSNSSQRMNSNGPCFPANNKRSARRMRTSYKYSSERSVSSFDSDSDTIPLMTEPEPFHDYSDDLAGSVDVVSESRMHSENFTRFKDGLSNMPGQNQEAVVRKQHGNKHRSLSQKYRPKSFKELIGQNMVVESLSNAILRAKIAPVYLFHGPRGTGKTTAAKIFTNAMNCLSIEELRPCGLCKECTVFNTGQNYDVKQVDAAANNDVESMRLLLKLVSLPPTTSRYKVFIVDDCHSLTAEAWNALLKSLEEPPSYVVFILITTDVEQLPRTAISRCQKFMFSRVKDADIVLRLRKLALQERVDIELEALQFIATRSDGSFRDAENMLDQLSLLGKKVTLATVQEMVGLIPDEKLAKLLELALAGNTVSTVNTIRELMESGVEPLSLTCQLATLITDILSGKDRTNGNMVMKVRKDEEERLKQVLVILSEAEKQLRSCSDRTTWLTAAFLQFAPKEPCLLPSSSRGTSVTQSPIAFVDTSEKETLDPDSATTRLSWGGDESGEFHTLYKKNHASFLQGAFKLDGGPQKQTDNHVPHLSGPFGDNRIHPCDQSPQVCTSKWERPSARRASPGIRSAEQRENSSMSPSTMDSIWKKVLQGSRSNGLKQILQGKGKLVSLSVTEAFVVAYLEFQHPEHKSIAEKARPNIANAFQMALGCPVEVEIALLSSASDMNLVGRDNSFCVSVNSEHSSKHINQEVGLSQERTRMRGSSRKSSTSFRNLAPAISSPLHHSLECRRSGQSFEIEARTHSRRSTDVSVKDFDVHKLKDLSNPHVMNSDEAERLCCPSKHVQDVQEEEGASMPCQGNDSDNDDDYYSGSEGLSDRDAPGALCWRGVKTSKNKHGRRQMRQRRRKGRFLLKLVPCAKGGGRS